MDKKHNKHIFQKIKKRTLVSGVKRAVSLVLCFALVLTAMPIIEIKDDGGIVVKFGLIDATEKVANAASSEYSPTLRGSAASVTLTSYNDILAYAQGGTWTVGGTSYSGYDPGDTVTLDLSDAQTIDSSFLGIGTSSNPFSGTLIIAGGANGIGGDSAFLTYKASLFNYISESTTILDDSNNPCYIKLTSGSSSLPLFADHVIGDGNSSTKAEWKFYISGSNVTSGGIIGTIGTSDSSKAACVSATVKDGTSGCTVSSSENAGVICRTLEVNSSLDLTIEAGTSSETTPTLKQTSISTTAANSHAGGLIGEMKTGSALTLKSNLSFASARTISAKGGVAYAGGLVGKCCGTVDLKETNEDPNTGETTITYYPYTDIYTSVINGSTTGGAGGAFGYYEATGEAAFDLENEYKITAVKLGGKNCGGFIGELKLNSSTTTETITINGDSTNQLQAYTAASSGTNVTNFGGLVGSYSCTNLEQSLIINKANTWIRNDNKQPSVIGGVVANVENNCYVKVDDATVVLDRAVADNNIAKDAGIIGLAGSGIFIDITGNVKVSTTNKNTAKIGAGLVGTSTSGIIRVSGQTDLSEASNGRSTGIDNANCSLLVNARNNTLVYALGNGQDHKTVTNEETGEVTESGWTLIRPYSNSANNGSRYNDDIGDWGCQIYRLIGEISDSKKTLEDAGVVSVTGHVVEVQKPTLITTVATEDTIEIAGTLDFAKTALYIQLNRDTSGYGSLAFEDSTCIAGTLLSKNIKFTGNVDLSESGFMGFTRMNEKDDNGTFKGSSIDGGNHYINLAMGEAYGYRENTSTLAEDMTVMSGVIHKENGNLVLALFYKVEPTTALAVKDLTIGGQVSAIVWKGNNGTTEGNLYMGGLAETVASGKIYNFSNVTSQTKFNFINNAETPVYIGGVFAIDGSGNNTYNISNCMIKPKINYDYASTLHKGHVYSGGFIGFVSNGKNAEINVNGTTIGTNTTTNNCTNKQYAGGLVGCFEQGNNIPTRKVVLNNVDINGANITLKSGSNNTAEESFTNIGLLGGRWYDVNVYFGSKTSSSDDYGVKITDATINLNNTKVGQNFYAGGLVSRASGYWQVNDVDVNGLKVNSTNASNRFGVLAGSCFDGGHALYLEITSSTAYTIASGGLTIGDVSKFDVLDEIAARSKKDETNRQGIVSIHTTSGKLSMAVTGNEYQLQSGYEKAKQNPNTRYYYNLDYLMQNFDSLPTSTDEEKAYKNGVQFLLWSINQYCLSNGVNNSGSPGGSAVVTANRKCFANFTTIPKKVTCNLEYLSYYPIDVTGNVTLEELTIKLNNSAMETAHGTNMSTRTANSQHYRMHEAVFKDVTGNITLSTKTSLKLQGNVPVIDGISGALICGTVQGNSVTKPAKLNLNNVILDGICLSNSSENGYDGLLVYKLGDYSTTTINRVSTTDAYNTDSTTTSTAAKTLISVAEGENTSITFTDMRLDGRKSTSTLKSDTHLDSAYNTHYSIFSVSTFVGSLKTNSAIYNYDHQEDWGTDGKTHTHHVTYGSEVYNSIENAGLQHWYLDKAKAKDANGYTSPVSYEASAAYDFATNGFLPHVSVPYTNGTDGQHEVAVNLVSVEIEQGCGTYNDPFVITDGAQLQAVANALNDTTDAGGFKKGFALYIDNDYGVSTTDINFEKWDSDISGGTNHTHYGFNGSKFVELDETGAETTTDGPSVDAVKQYLAGAYYVLQGSTEEGGNQNELTFSGIYPGLGGTVAKYAFRGVLIGKHTDSSKNIKIINNSDKPLIKLSMGSVVKNIDVEYKNAITITNTNQGNNKDRYTIDSTTLPYFGGVFGKIMGGDNIIDKVSVKYDSTVTITQNDNYKEEVIPMGGYVGAVVNGTLVFRNMTGISTDAASTGFTVKLNRRNTAYPSGMQVNDAICKQDMIPA